MTGPRGARSSPPARSGPAAVALAMSRALGVIVGGPAVAVIGFVAVVVRTVVTVVPVVLTAVVVRAANRVVERLVRLPEQPEGARSSARVRMHHLRQRPVRRFDLVR